MVEAGQPPSSYIFGVVPQTGRIANTAAYADQYPSILDHDRIIAELCNVTNLTNLTAETDSTCARRTFKEDPHFWRAIT